MMQQSTSGYTTKRTESRGSHRYLYSDVHSSIIYNNKKVGITQLSTNRCMEKLRSTHTMEHHWTIKWNETLRAARTWKNPENTVLCEVTHNRMDIVWCHLQEISRTGNFIEKESKPEAGGKERMRSSCFTGTEFLSAVMKIAGNR